MVSIGAATELTWDQTQSARGENQNRAGSGFAGSESTTRASAPPNATSATYPDRADNANNVLSPTGVDVHDHDPSSYGYTSHIGTGHNGAGHGPY